MTLPLSRRIATGILTPDMRKIRTYLWSSRMEYSIRRAMTVQMYPSTPVTLASFLPHM